MCRKMLGTVAAVVVMCAFGSANAKEPVKLSNKQLTKITAGAFNAQVPVAAALVGNGAGPYGTNQFSPSTTNVTQTQTALGLNLFTIDGGPQIAPAPAPVATPIAAPAPMAMPGH